MDSSADTNSLQYGDVRTVTDRRYRRICYGPPGRIFLLSNGFHRVDIMCTFDHEIVDYIKMVRHPFEVPPLVTSMTYTPKPRPYLFMTDHVSCSILRIDVKTGVVEIYATRGESGAQFAALNGITADQDGNVYVVDRRRMTVSRISVDRTVKTIAGEIGGPAFNPLSGISLGIGGQLYVTEAHSVRKIDIDSGVVTNITRRAETWEVGYVDGPVDQAKFYYPNSVCQGLDGVLYVVDFSNYRIRIISDDQKEVSTFVGSGRPTSRDGRGELASFRRLLGATFDPIKEAVYTIDNMTVRMIQTKCSQKYINEIRHVVNETQFCQKIPRELVLLLLVFCYGH